MASGASSFRCDNSFSLDNGAVHYFYLIKKHLAFHFLFISRKQTNCSFLQIASNDKINTQQIYFSFNC